MASLSSRTLETPTMPHLKKKVAITFLHINSPYTAWIAAHSLIVVTLDALQIIIHEAVKIRDGD